MAYDIDRQYSKEDIGKGQWCRNRRALTPDKRRHSPSYDDEGDPGQAWYEGFGVIKEAAYCTFGDCTDTDRKIWEKFTQNFFLRTFNPAVANLRQAVPTPHSDLVRTSLSEAGAVNKSFNAHLSQVRRDDHGFWSPMALHSDIEGLINHMDEAACQLDFVISPLMVAVGRGDLAPSGPKEILPTGAPGGKKWIDGGAGGGGAPPKEEGSLGTKAVGVVLLGGALYFGYKVLTE